MLSHPCKSCDYKLCEEVSEIFDHLLNLEPPLSNEIKMAIVYIAGYITRNDNKFSEYETHFIMKCVENIPIQLTVEN